MEQRHLDFGIGVTRDQWDELCRLADSLGADDGGYAWQEQDPEEIRVALRDTDAPALWRDFVTDTDSYGSHTHDVAQFRFNGGRPYANLSATDGTVRPPRITPQEEGAMQKELERWVRGKWQELLRRSGLHYDRGHISPEE